MRTISACRERLETLLPGLDAALAKLDLEVMERPGSPALDAFRASGGPGLLVPQVHGGLGASAVDALACARAIGSRSPSLAVATTMHHFSVASLVALAEHSDGFEWMLLDAVATDRLLVSSAFAEGRTGQGILSPTVTAVRDGTAWLLSGRKKPCSLSRSMDLMTASVALDEGDGAEPELGVALVPATVPGISVRPFWGSDVLAGAESDEVVLEDVRVEDELMIRPRLDPGSNLDNLQTVGLVWFSLLVSAGYVGVATALVERVLDHGVADPATRGAVALELESAYLALERVAMEVDEGHTDNDTLAAALTVRYAAQRSVADAVSRSVGLLGGMAFIGSPEVAALASSATAFQFHPPSVRAGTAALDAWLGGAVVRID